MWKCESCARHVMPGAPICPFCASRSAATLGMAILGPLVLSACYGLPPCDEDEIFDDDNDGWSVGMGCELPGGEEEDCDDANADVNPGAEELCGDDLDNNCDWIVAGPDQTETCNGLDDDCDDVVDDGAACDTGWDTSATDTGAPTEPPTGGISLQLGYESPAPVTTCAEAGLAEVTVALALFGEPATELDLPCDDLGVLLQELAPGDYALTVTGQSGDATRGWASGPVSAFVVPGETLQYEVTLACDPLVAGACG